MTRTERLQQSENRQAAFVPGAEWYELRVSPTCPPSKSVTLRGGRLYAGYNPGWASFDVYEQRAYTVPELTADLDDTASVTVDVTFTNAGYYQLFLLELKLPAVVENPAAGDWAFNLHGTNDELATAELAEAWMNSTTFTESSPWYHGALGTAYPLCGLVLKNNGQVGVSGAFLPVGLVNRGESYIWPRDMRPRQYIAR